jgi:two-component system, NarL family, invasion response regulator UvrY
MPGLSVIWAPPDPGGPSVTQRSKVVRVFHADDHIVVREGVARMLSAHPELELVGSGSDRTAALTGVIGMDPDVCLLDLQMPGSGIALIGQMHTVARRTAIVIFTAYRADQYAELCLAAGASGFVNKGATEGELVAVIIAAADGHRTIAAGLEETAITDEPHKVLSLRELEVVVRLATGEPAGDIAVDLGISIKTVSTFRARALNKLGLQSNAELTRYALEHHLIV